MNAISDRYRRRADAFERKVAAVRLEQWSNPSPCAKWTARDVVQHVLDMHGVMLRSLDRSVPESAPAPSIEADPLGAFRAARAEVEAILADRALASTEVDTPMGRVTAEEHVDQVASEDLPLHGWDLAKATGQDDAIDAEDLEIVWEKLLEIPAETMERFRTPGAFGPDVEVFGAEVPVPADAPLQDRLLGLIGRDPRWTPPNAG